MTPVMNNTSLNSDSYYAGAKPSPSLSRVQQHQATPRSHLPSPRTGSLTLTLKPSLPAMDLRFNSANTSAALEPSPLSPKDPKVFIDDFSASFDDDFDQIDNDSYVVSNENIPPRASNDVSCTAVFRAGGESAQLTVKDTRAVEKRAVTVSPIASEGWRLPFTNRKRIIDEIFEDCGGKVNTPPRPPAKKSSSIHSVASEKQTHSIMGIDGDLWENDWQIEESVPKPSRKSNQTRLRSDSLSDGSCDFSSLSYRLEGNGRENTRHDEPSLAQKLALKSGSAKSSVPPPLASQQAKKVTTSLSCHSEEEQQLSLVQDAGAFSAPRTFEQTTESMPKASQCSFFTAGSARLGGTLYVMHSCTCTVMYMYTHTHTSTHIMMYAHHTEKLCSHKVNVMYLSLTCSGPDEDEGDMFGSVFAGIF